MSCVLALHSSMQKRFLKYTADIAHVSNAFRFLSPGCPQDWTRVDNICIAPDSYAGMCSPALDSAKTDKEKATWGMMCEATWHNSFHMVLACFPVLWTRGHARMARPFLLGAHIENGSLQIRWKLNLSVSWKAYQYRHMNRTSHCVCDMFCNAVPQLFPLLWIVHNGRTQLQGNTVRDVLCTYSWSAHVLKGSFEKHMEVEPGLVHAMTWTCADDVHHEVLSSKGLQVARDKTVKCVLLFLQQAIMELLSWDTHNFRHNSVRQQKLQATTLPLCDWVTVHAN